MFSRRLIFFDILLEDDYFLEDEYVVFLVVKRVKGRHFSYFCLQEF